MFGYTSQELVGRELTMLMPEYLRHMHRAAVKQLLEAPFFRSQQLYRRIYALR